MKIYNNFSIGNIVKYNTRKVDSVPALKMETIQDSFTFSGRQKSSNGEWSVIYSIKKDPENYQENIKKLRKIARKGLYSGRFGADKTLQRYDYHVFMDSHKKPLLLMRVSGRNVNEIRSNKDGTIDGEYINLINDYIAKNNLVTSGSASIEMEITNNRTERLKKYKNDLAAAIHENNVERIFHYFNIKTDKDSEGNLSISEYRQPDCEITYKDIGIDERNLVEHVVTVDGDADFSRSSLVIPGAIEYIGGNAKFTHSNIIHLGNIEVIEGDADFNDSKVKYLSKLEYIGGNANFRGSKIVSLENLEHIENNAFFRESAVSDIGRLNYIGGDITYINSPLTKKHFINVARRAK